MTYLGLSDGVSEEVLALGSTLLAVPEEDGTPDDEEGVKPGGRELLYRQGPLLGFGIAQSYLKVIGGGMMKVPVELLDCQFIAQE